MGLLNRLSSDRSSKSPVERPRLDRLDPFLGDRDLRTGYRSLVDGDWRRLEKFLDNSQKGWMFRSIVTGEVVGLEPVTFERWVEFRHSPRSRVYYAAVQIRDAYADRAASLASPEGPSMAAADSRLTKNLKAAEEILYEVIRDRPAMAEPWVVLLISGRGLQVDLDEIKERYENAHSRAPFNPDASREYLQSLTKKWGGSNIATFDLARWLEKESSPSSPTREALPVAHIEKGLLDQGRADLADYLTKPNVIAELATGLNDFLQAIPSDAPTETLRVLNAYALAISVTDESTARLVAETFARIDNRPTEFPWSVYSEDVNDIFSEIQADQLRFASRY